MSTTESTVKVQPRLKERYRNEIRDTLHKQFGYGNVMQIPTVTKVVVNMGVGEAARDAKLREGMPIGVRVTLRGDRMWEFLDRLTSIALPRIRDFRGLSPKQFDGVGNYTFGLAEQSVFHEIDVDKIDRVRGMDINVVTSATTDDEGRALLRALGFPFKEN